MFIGSEGILGIITEAWMRVRKRPSFRASTTVRFKDFYAGADAVRAISQAGLYPANCRLLQAEEAAYTGPADKDAAVVVLSFESADHPVDAWMKRALELVAEHGGSWDAEALLDQGSHRAGAAGEWRDKFVRMPYLSEHMVARGIAATTFESAITWDRFKDFHSNVMDATRKAIKRVTGREGSLTCRFTHLYPDGPAPYFTLTCPLDKTKMLDQLRDITHVGLQALVENGGTITHHHAVGRLHRPYYDQQRPELFAKALRAAKRALDPKGMLNPGVLIDPDR
jgi:alkyldihydroxyacetonephosphate synthase